MRHIVWLAGCLLVLSCTVDNDNLNTGGTGGALATGGKMGTAGTGGQIGTGGVSATGGQIGTGGASATGGQLGTGGASATGGAGGCPRCVGTGGVSATGGNMGTGGSATGGHGAGGSGTGGSGGQGGGKSCDALESEYNSAFTAAKKCTLGAANQCQQLVNSSLSCPGCKQYVNDTTTLSALQTEWDDQNCSAVPHLCPAIACVIPTAGVCTSSPTGGPGPSAEPTGTCVNAQLTPAN
jgi:hypothetical protein